MAVNKYSISGNRPMDHELIEINAGTIRDHWITGQTQLRRYRVHLWTDGTFAGSISFLDKNGNVVVTETVAASVNDKVWDVVNYGFRTTRSAGTYWLLYYEY